MNVVTHKETLDVMKTMKRHEALGPDGMPIEAFKKSEEAQVNLVTLMNTFEQRNNYQQTLGV